MDDHGDLSDHGGVVQRLRMLGTQPIGSARQSTDLAAMAAVRPLRSSRSRLKIAAAVLAGFALGSTSLAAADVLPDPAQHVAHTTLKRVGVDVPNPARYHDDAECGTEQKKNHGAYVRDDHSLATSDCGKPMSSVGAGDDQGSDEPKPEKGSCEGKPTWAGDKALTKEERKAQVAERVAQCGDSETTDLEATDTEDETKLDSTSDTNGAEAPKDHAENGEDRGGPDEPPAITMP